MRWSGVDDDESEPWFRIGQLEVNTTILIAVVWLATLLVFAAEGPSRTVTQYLWMTNNDVAGGEVWRLITYPFAHVQFGFYEIVNAVLLVMFGLELERIAKRRPFALLMVFSILIIGVAATVLAQLLGDGIVLYDLDLLELTVILLFCAEHPRVMFFGIIPSWAVAGVIVAIEFVNDLANREWVRMLTVIVAAALISLVAKKVGLLSAYDRIPDLGMPRRRERPEPAIPPVGNRPAARPSDPRGDDGPRRGGSLWGRRAKEQEEAEIVPMPPQRPRPVAEPTASADDLALDALLDTIADGGLEALTPAERAELDELRARRRKD